MDQINYSLKKENRLRKINGKMFGWSKAEIADGIDLYKKLHDGPPKIIVLIPKRVVPLATMRNKFRRKTREIFRKNVSRDVGAYYLIKFKSIPKSFEKKLELCFKNV